MTSDEMVSALVSDLRPVSPLRHPAVRAGRWLLVAVVGGTLAVLAYGVRPDWRAVGVTPEFLIQTGLLVMATVVAAAGSLTLAVPGERLSLVRRAAPVAAVAAWAAWLAIDVGMSTGLVIDNGWGCVGKAISIAAIPGVALLVMVARGAPIETLRALTLAALAAAAVGAIGVGMACPNVDAAHLLMWHVSPVIALPGAAALIAAPLVEAATRRRSHALR
ncbi:MAG: NrsF family protein [Vicinamibacterales bacterium]